jgi:hypothetical protein
LYFLPHHNLGIPLFDPALSCYTTPFVKAIKPLATHYLDALHK